MNDLWPAITDNWYLPPCYHPQFHRFKKIIHFESCLTGMLIRSLKLKLPSSVIRPIVVDGTPVVIQILSNSIRSFSDKVTPGFLNFF